MKKSGILNKTLALAGALLLALGALLPVPALAASAEYHSRDITVALEDDGSATVTEVWDLTANEGTEVYFEILNLDEQEVSDLSVSENGVQFQNIGSWDVNASFDEKAGRCGMVQRPDGYELCWGLGSYGRHTFTVTYRMTNMVKGYADAEVIEQTFVRDFSGQIDSMSVTIYREGVEFTVENTGVWAEGSVSGEIWVQEGKVVSYTTAPYQPGTEYTVLVQFAEGMFSPPVQRSETFEEVLARELEGSGYTPDEADSTDDGGDGYYEDDGWEPVYESGFSRFFSGVGSIFRVLLPMGFVGVVVAMLAKLSKSRSGSHSPGVSRMKQEYRDVSYSRALPWGGSLPATYTRLDDLSQLDSEGSIIGAHLLRWVRSRQVELTKQQAGIFGNKEEDAIKLYAAREGMEPLERRLYDMLLEAAGGDYVLQSKEFEKWSRKKYERVQGWLEQYKNQGKQVMRDMGAITEEEVKVFFGLIPSRRTVTTEAGDRLTAEMFGFKKYLEEFTIINEREAREVQLWDEYLVFAQVFGIADKVADQFKVLYPDYFTQMANELGYSRVDMFDIYLLTRMAGNYGRAAAEGYRAGYNAAHSSSSFGGGGGSFGGGGGGGGFSGSSGGGGGGVR